MGTWPATNCFQYSETALRRAEALSLSSVQLVVVMVIGLSVRSYGFVGFGAARWENERNGERQEGFWR